VIYLEYQDLLAIATRVIGTQPIVRDAGLLDAAAFRPRASVFGSDAYPTIHHKAGDAHGYRRSLVATGLVAVPAGLGHLIVDDLIVDDIGELAELHGLLGDPDRDVGNLLTRGVVGHPRLGYQA